MIGRIAADLGLTDQLPDLNADVPEFFGSQNIKSLALDGPEPLPLFEQLLSLSPDADTYFACLASLHKARLKYQVILETQPIPTLEQVGPRGLLQYGTISPSSLTALLFWRKWMFDIDNRAGQETGYLFEPVIAHALGGTPVPARRSPVKRTRDSSKGRQIDCLINQRAYEIKLRVTIAASGQGRWGEELDFPVDCRASGYTPVLVVLDGTLNPKLTELSRAFRDNGGEVFVGDAAWEHLDDIAGGTMSVFIDNYVREPLDHLFDELPKELPQLVLEHTDQGITIRVGEDELAIHRDVVIGEGDDRDTTPNDLFDSLPGT
ncbi:restriction endonuclease [Ruegeria atlantica]|uniref:Restriction endonuclease n=1 Tax=Ruegeria atlantica TaxID=81569 RepID=A0ABX1WHP0_9RHOB|nr:restriction endonuclease [Ruegeria atlantica]NOD32830.1 restriction endonuclease [Ruegeria atlantica]